MTPSWKERLPFLLRLAFILPVVAAVSINVIVAWPLWGVDHSRHAVLVTGALDPCLRKATQIEDARAHASEKKIGVLTYIKRNYKRWLKMYDRYKLKKMMKKLNSLTTGISQKSSE